MLTSELSRRLFAGLWFTVAAAIPVGSYFLISYFASMTSGTIFKAATIVFPIFSGGIIGLWLGPGILDEKKTKSTLQAAGRGVGIAALSYLLFFIIELSAALCYNSDLKSDELFRLVGVIAVMFLIGLIILGWLIAIAGAAAGGLLYLFRIRMMESPDESEEV